MDIQFLLLTNLILVLYVVYVLLDEGKKRLPMSETETRSREIIYDAVRQANRMLVEAELEGIEVVAREKLSAREVEKEYRQELRELFASLEKRSQRLEEQTEALMKGFLDELSQRVEGQVGGEINRLQESLAKYQHQREELIDTQAVELLERTLEITLGKSLDLDQHAGLVVDSLEEAKREGFFGVSGRISSH